MENACILKWKESTKGEEKTEDLKTEEPKAGNTSDPEDMVRDFTPI